MIATTVGVMSRCLAAAADMVSLPMLTEQWVPLSVLWPVAMVCVNLAGLLTRGCHLPQVDSPLAPAAHWHVQPHFIDFLSVYYSVCTQ